MRTASDNDTAPTILIGGASRGLGYAMAAEFVKREWNVVGTVRNEAARTLLNDLADEHPDRLSIKTLDINNPAQLESLHRSLRGRSLDILFISAGTTNNEKTQIGRVSTDDFTTIMITNALSPIRAVETLSDLVTPTGLIGVMTSGEGSITDNTTAIREVYRGSKAALNMFMRSVAIRQADTGRAFVLLAPGWVRTALGGPEATYTLEETAPVLVNVLIEKQGRPGLEYLDRFGQTVPW